MGTTITSTTGGCGCASTPTVPVSIAQSSTTPVAAGGPAPATSPEASSSTIATSFGAPVDPEPLAFRPPTAADAAPTQRLDAAIARSATASSIYGSFTEMGGRRALAEPTNNPMNSTGTTFGEYMPGSGVLEINAEVLKVDPAMTAATVAHEGMHGILDSRQIALRATLQAAGVPQAVAYLADESFAHMVGDRALTELGLPGEAQRAGFPAGKELDFRSWMMYLSALPDYGQRIGFTPDMVTPQVKQALESEYAVVCRQLAGVVQLPPYDNGSMAVIAQVRAARQAAAGIATSTSTTTTTALATA